MSALTPGSTLNKWDTLEASKWFATRVSDGRGGTHPRYTSNWYVEDGQQADELVNYLAGAVGSYCWDEGNGQWRMKVERPEPAMMIFTKENINGEFSYSHTDFDSRFNDYIGVFRNEEKQYQEDRCRVWDQPDIDNFGRRDTNIVLVGCTNRQEALRRLKIRLLTSLNEFRIVTFTTNRQGLMLEPFSTIGVADGDLLGDTTLRTTGRIIDMDATRRRVSMRDTLRLEPNVAYEIQVTVPNPDYRPNASAQPTQESWRTPTITLTRKVVNTGAQRGDVHMLYLDQPLPESVPEYAVVALSAPGLPTLPKAYRVTSIQPNEENNELVVITATEIYTRKWEESDNVSEDELHAQVPNSVVPSPTEPAAGMWSVRQFVTEAGTKQVLTATWVRPLTMFLKEYRLEYQYNGGPWVSLGTTNETFWEFQNPEVGIYTLRIYAVDRRGYQSTPLVGTYGVTEVGNSDGPAVGSLTFDSVVLAADTDGTVHDWKATYGDFRLYLGAVEIVSGVTFSLEGTTGGAVATIDPTSGVYAVSAMTEDQGSVTFAATYRDVTIERRLSIVKVRRAPPGVPGADGAPGAPGINSATLLVYQRAATEPATPSLIVKYTFSTGEVSNLNNGWSRKIPQGSQPLWVTSAAVNSAQNTDEIAANEWSDPVVMAQDGANGINNATVYLFARTDSAVAPPTPSADVTYTFSTSEVTGLTNGWEPSLPTTGGRWRWITMATALSQSGSDVINPDEWAQVALLAVDGANGSDAATPVMINMSASAVSLWAYANGAVLSYEKAIGSFYVSKGDYDITSQVSYSVTGSAGVEGYCTTNGLYGVTSMDSAVDSGTLTFTITYEGVSYVRILSVTKARGGYEIVDSLPVNNLFVGRVIFLTTDNKLYRYASGGWTAAVAIEDLPPDLASAVGQRLDLAHIAGQIQQTQISDGAISTPKLAAGAVTTANLAAGSVTAEKLILASRKALAQGFQFRVEGGALRWDTGTIFWTDDNGNYQQTTVLGGAASWNGSYVHVYWRKGAPNLTKSDGNWVEAMDPNTLELAIWQGGTTLAVYYGTTVIDGDQVLAGTIKARNMAAESVTTDSLQAGAVTAAKLAATELITLKAQIRDGLIDNAKIADLSVTNAKIENLTIGTVKIQDNAITRATSFYNDYNGAHSALSDYVWTTVGPRGGVPMQVSLAIPDQLASNTPFVTINSTLLLARDGGDDDSLNFRVLRSDGVALPQVLTSVRIHPEVRPYHFQFVDDKPPFGQVVTYSMQYQKIPGNGSPYVNDCVMTGVLYQK